jgi:hypothetical protein
LAWPLNTWRKTSANKSQRDLADVITHYLGTYPIIKLERVLSREANANKYGIGVVFLFSFRSKPV